MKNIIVLIAIVFSVVWSQDVLARTKPSKRTSASVGERYVGHSRVAVYKNARGKGKRSISSVRSKKAKAKKAVHKGKIHARKKKHKY